MAEPRDITAFLKSRRYLIIGVLVVLAIVGTMGYRALRPAKAAPAARRAAAQTVSVASVESLSPQNLPLSVIGQVLSQNQATILAQTSGEITSLDKAVGDAVSAGETIATIDNASEAAAVTEAEGAYDAAEAALVKTSGGQEGSSGGIGADANGAANTDATLRAGLSSAYASLDDAVHTKADTLFDYPRSSNPMLLQPFNAVQYTMVDGTYPFQTAESERLSIESMLANDYELTLATSSADLDANIAAMTSDAQTTEAFLNTMAEAVNALEAADEDDSYTILPLATVTGYQTTIAAARTEVASAISSLTSTLSVYDASGDEAQVEEEEGALESAKAALAKTYITSPISGTIVDLPITQGDYVSANQEVAEVSNPGALKIVAHVSAEDAEALSIGNPVSVNGASVGVITQISPAIDPETGTIEVDVALSGQPSGLVDGDSVTIGLDRTSSTAVSADHSSASGAPAVIPITALKIAPTGPEVFTVDPEKSVLVAHQVETGSILGSDITVTSGLSPDLVIVTDARGLVAGQSVTVAKQPSSSAASAASAASSTAAE